MAAGAATRCNTQEAMQHALRITATAATYNIFLAFSPAAFTDSDLCASCTNCMYSADGGPDARQRTLETVSGETELRL